MLDMGRDSIRRGITRVRARWWRVSLLRTTLRVFFYALLAGALALLLFPALGLGGMLLSALAVSALAALATSVWIAPDQVTHAKAYDDAAGLADRVSSAVELEDRSGPMVEALRAEAARVATTTPSGQVYPYRVPRECRWLPIPALLVAAAFFLPTFFGSPALADEAFVTSLEQRIEQLEELLSEERNKELSGRNKEILEELERLRVELDAERVDKKDTQAEIARLLDQLKQEEADQKEKEQQLKELLKSLQENTQKQELDPDLQQGDFQQALNRLKEELERLEKELERKKKEGATPDELKQLEQEIAKLKEIEAKLMLLMQLNMDMAFTGKTIDFLHAWDGELGDLAEFDPAAIEAGEP